MIIHLKYNVQNVCAAFIVLQDNVEYFDSNEFVKFILFKDDSSHNIDKLSVTSSTRANKRSSPASFISLEMLANMFTWQSTTTFTPLKQSSRYSIQLTDFLYLLQSANVDVDSVSADNVKLAKTLETFLLQTSGNVTFEYASMTHTYAVDTNFVLDCSSATNIDEVTQYVYMKFLPDVAANTSARVVASVKYAYMVQTINMQLLIAIHVLFVVIFVLFMKYHILVT